MPPTGQRPSGRLRTVWIRAFPWLILCLSNSQFILAAPTTFVDGSDPSCGGNAPCYSWLTLAVQNVDNKGEVVITGDVAQTLNTSHGKTGVTVRGLSGTESINNVALLGPPLVDWVFRDFQPTIAIKIENVSGSLLIQNVKTQAVSIGDFTSDTTANIVVEHSEILPGGAGGISITGADGIDIAGQIDIRDNVIDRAINVQVRGTAEEAVLGADINVLRNEGYLGGGIRGIAPYGSGKATITGDIVVADNVFDPLASKFGVSLAENVEGDFAGNVTMLRNDLAWLAFLNQFSAGGSMLGDLVVSDNYAETIEIDIWGDMVGDVVAQRNRIEYRGGGRDWPSSLFFWLPIPSRGAWRSPETSTRERPSSSDPSSATSPGRLSSPTTAEKRSWRRRLVVATSLHRSSSRTTFFIRRPAFGRRWSFERLAAASFPAQRSGGTRATIFRSFRPGS